MTQDDKDLLLKDLCSRLPYGVQMNHIADNEVSPVTLIGIDRDYVILQGAGGYSYVPVEDYKPYLLPLSSMTEEQRKELKSLMIQDSYGILYHTIESYDYLNKNHFDYRGLIEKSLALNATGLNIYIFIIIK
jgi:hypothetical protein